MKVVRKFPKARLPQSTPEGVIVYAFETFKTEFGEMHNYRTGISIELPEKAVALLVPTLAQAQAGVFVQGMIHSGHKGELVVPIANLNRNAYEVHQGMPIARLLFLDSQEESIEEDTEAEKQPGGIADPNKVTPPAGGASTGPKAGGAVGDKPANPDGSTVKP